jgi:hypothetical protein
MLRCLYCVAAVYSSTLLRAAKEINTLSCVLFIKIKTLISFHFAFVCFQKLESRQKRKDALQSLVT